MEKIPEYRIRPNGTILEWIEDYEEHHPGHRHLSHLLGVYPFTLITEQTPDLLEAAKNTVKVRYTEKGSNTGWSLAHSLLLSTRFRDTEMCISFLNQLLKDYTSPNFFDKLWKTSPLFQIDGNFGATAGIAEMLVQSHNGYIELLPVLPGEWPEGKVKGLVARGGYTVDIEWQEGRLLSADITASTDTECRIKYAGIVKILDLKAGKRTRVNHSTFL